MSLRPKSKTLLKSITLASVAFMTLIAGVVPADAQSTGQNRNQMRSEPNSIAGDSLVHTELYYALGHPDGANQLDTSFPGGQINYGPQGETAPAAPRLTNVGTVWPELTAPFPTMADERTAATFNKIASVTGVNNPAFGAMPATAMGTAMIQAAATQLLADYEADPQNAMARAKEEQNQANQTSADTNAQMERNQAGSAIDFVASYLYNFTVEANNKWNRVRNELFLPMALLLLLPGVVLAQLKATVSAGTPVIADVTSPFDGILRAIVGIFLIPGTYLFINYGIDVSNSITYTIQSEYRRIFGTDMYRDAMCAHIRAFPYRNQNENLGYVPNREANMGPLGRNRTTFAEFEGHNLEVALRDPCANLNDVPGDRTNEQVSHVVNAQRNSYNTINSALAMTWNILCAFQMAYLYYLWFVGPVIAALWVYPMKELREAFPAWINGVCTICFWSLFWNTTILLMACCRGVDETGTLIMSALNFLSTACVKFAFDFASLAKEMGSQAAKMAEKGGAAGAKGGQGAAGKDGASSGHGGPPSYAQGGQHQPATPVTANHAAPLTSMDQPSASRVVGADGAAGFTYFNNTDNPTLNGGDPHSRGLTANAGGSQDLNVPAFDFPAPPGVDGNALQALADANASQTVGDVSVSAGSLPPASDTNGDGVPDGGNVAHESQNMDAGTAASAGIVDLGTITAAGVTGQLTASEGQFGQHTAMNIDGSTNVGGDTHNNALTFSQGELATMFLNSDRAQELRAQLASQMQMEGGPGGINVAGAPGPNGEPTNQFISASQLGQMFSAADAQYAAGNANFNVAELAKQAGVDLPSLSFSGLNMSPIAATEMAALNNGQGNSNGGMPPMSEFGRSSNDFGANGVAGMGPVPMTDGAGANGGVIPPNVVEAQRQATMDKIASEIQGSIQSIQAQQTQEAQSRYQQAYQDTLNSGMSTVTAMNGNGFGTGTGTGNGNGDGYFQQAAGQGTGNGMPGTNDPTLNAMSAQDLRNASMTPMLNDVFGSAVPNVPSGANGLALPNVDTSQVAALAQANAQAQLQNQGGQGMPVGPGNGGTGDFLAQTAPGAGQGQGNVESAGSYLSRSVQEQWTGQNGFENRMVNASIDDQARARESVDARNQALMGQMPGGQTLPATEATNYAGSSGYVANQPQNYAQAAADTGNAFGNAGQGTGQPGAPAPIDPLAKESMDRMAQTFQGFVPDVQQGQQRSGVDVNGLGSGGGTGTVSYDASQTGYAQNSALGSAANTSALSQIGPNGPTEVLPTQGSANAGGFVANAPNAANAGQPVQETAGQYLSRNVQEQWTGQNGFENRMVNASVDDQVRARESVDQRGQALAGQMSGGQVLPSTESTSYANNTTTGGGYIANSPQSYSQASASADSSAYAQSGNTAQQHGAPAPVDPLAKESMDKMAQTFQGFVPDVPQGQQQQRVDATGLGGGNGSSGVIASQSYDAVPSNYAQNSAVNAAGSSSALPTSGPTGGTTSDGGFVANAPGNAANNVANNAQPGEFNKSSYLSQQVGEQWKNYEQRVDNAIASDHRAQMNNAVESTYSRASGPLQDSVTGGTSSLPTNAAPGGGGGLVNQPSGDAFSAPSQNVQYQQNQQASYSESAPQLARSSSDAHGQGYGHGAHSAGGSGSNDAAYNSSANVEARRQIDELAKAVDSTPDVTRHSSHTHHGTSHGGTESVPSQGLQYYVQSGPVQGPAQAPNSLPSVVPVPGQISRYGNVANNRADALKSATQNRAKESVTGPGLGKPINGGNGGNKLNSALGRAGSTAKTPDGKVPAAAGGKAIKDPLGTVSTGSTLRRLRQKRKWSQEEIEAFKKLAGGAEQNDWDM